MEEKVYGKKKNESEKNKMDLVQTGSLVEADPAEPQIQGQTVPVSLPGEKRPSSLV